MTEFKVGDRVQNISNATIPKGDCGTVVAIDHHIGVEWDEFDKGHGFDRHDGVCIKKSKHGWWVKAEDVEPICAPEINIKIENDSPFEVTKENKEMPRFEFKTEERTRIDKTCNGTIPMVTTKVTINGRTGEATCDKAEYNERQGVLEALANAVCGDNFYKVYAEAVRQNKIADKKSRTCTYCHKVFDTVEEKENHESWHIECKKARRGRYLLRKRAKEIAFEEQAQAMAKDMLATKKND